MTILIKIFSGLFGYDYKRVMQQPTVSRQKVVTLGTLILIPVALWTFSGFYLSYYLMGAGIAASILVAFVMGGIILIVDRSFVATPKSERGGWLRTIRIGFALVSTVLGSLAIDMVLFSGDLEEYRQAKGEKQVKLYSQEYREKQGGELLRLLDEKRTAQSRHEALLQAYIRELDGSGGTGRYGEGKVAMAKEQEKDRAASEVKRLEEGFVKARADLEEKALAHAEERAAKRGDALLSKLRDLHEFVLSDRLTLGFYLIFFVFVLMLETFFVMYKSVAADTIYEQFLQAEEEFGHQQLEAYRVQKARITRERDLLGEDYEKVKRLVSGEPRR